MKHKVILSKNFAGSNGIQELICTREGMQFEPGNCIDILNPISGIKKPYSIASSPKDENLSFFIKAYPSKNGVSQYVRTLNPGDEIEISMPFGYFTPGKDCTPGKYIYIATGTGMSPFVSAMWTYKHLPAMILYGVQTYNDILPIPAHALGLYKFAVSREDSPLPKHLSGHFDKLPVDKSSEYEYYICGLEEMISDTLAYLLKNGVPWDKVHTEQFYYTKQ